MDCFLFRTKVKKVVKMIEKCVNHVLICLVIIYPWFVVSAILLETVYSTHCQTSLQRLLFIIMCCYLFLMVINALFVSSDICYILFSFCLLIVMTSMNLLSYASIMDVYWKWDVYYDWYNNTFLLCDLSMSSLL